MWWKSEHHTEGFELILWQMQKQIVDCDQRYSGSKNRPDVWMFFTKVNNPTHLLTWALTCECMKERPYHRLSMGPRVKRTG
jgi:hypothetical protein